MAELTTCEVKLARAADAALIARMSRDYIEQGLRWRWRTRQIRAKIANPETVVLVAKVELGGVRFIGGFAVMDFPSQEASPASEAPEDFSEHLSTQLSTQKGLLSLLAVHPSLRRMGVGGKLVRWLHKSARVAGCQHIELQVRADNIHARRFYNRMGYSEEALLNGYYDGKIAAYQMKLRLARP
ncbi:MAG: GNAT family N-acetyltransferase [Gammaproteobacteria bacterium]|nr:GNAT family N-acetyltransferase [Gammaproteobacteria bacterium]